MRRDWKYKFIKGIAVLGLLSTYIPSMAVCTTVVAQELEKKSEEVLLENDFLKVTTKSEVSEEGRHWHISYTQKNLTKKRNLVFSVYNGDKPLSPELISQETMLQFTSSDNERWHQKEFTGNLTGSFSFTTPNEEGWYLVFHDLEEDDEVEESEEGKISYKDLMEDSKIGPFDLKFEETSTSQTKETNAIDTMTMVEEAMTSRTENEVSTSKSGEDTEDSSTTTTTSNEESKIDSEGASDSDDLDIVGKSGFRSVGGNGVDPMNPNDLVTHPSKIVPPNAISTDGIFDLKTTINGESIFTDFLGKKHQTGFSADKRAFYIAGKDTSASVFF